MLLAKKSFRLLLSLFVVFICMSGNAFSQTAGWYTCSVVKIGAVDTTTNYVYLTDTAGTPAFTAKAFRMVNTGIINAQLAILLTAISSGKNVYAYVGNSQMTYAYIVN